MSHNHPKIAERDFVEMYVTYAHTWAFSHSAKCDVAAGATAVGESLLERLEPLCDQSTLTMLRLNCLASGSWLYEVCAGSMVPVQQVPLAESTFSGWRLWETLSTAYCFVQDVVGFML